MYTHSSDMPQICQDKEPLHCAVLVLSGEIYTDLKGRRHDKRPAASTWLITNTPISSIPNEQSPHTTHITRIMDIRSAASYFGLGGGRAAAPTAARRLLNVAPHPYFLAAGALLSAGQLAYGVYDAVQRSEERKGRAKAAEIKARAATLDLEKMEAKMKGAYADRLAAEEKARVAEERRAEATKQREAAEAAEAQAQELRREAEERLMRGIPPEVRPTNEAIQRFRERYKIQSDKINIAIVGESGMGKSTLLNSLRGLSPGDPNAAESGFNEMTATVKGYPDTHNPSVMWYDVPGANTPTIQGWMYFVQQGLFVFDVLVIVFADRFTQTVGTLINNANKCSIPTFIVRTKSDQLVNNVKDDSPHPLSDQAARDVVVSQTRDTVMENLAKLGLPNQRVYIVSRAAMKRWVLGQDRSNLIDEEVFLDDIFPSMHRDGGNEGTGA
ncbi:interferon-inducible GTPase-domain-containing protein [Panaeolus papilionaceus]|nr:interferon-inducible GTPase-domain-containing protein [Panaeolus papilionaceus]